MINLYLTRHGQTEFNLKSIAIGQLDSLLTDDGIIQSKNKGKALQDAKIDWIYTSDLGRCLNSSYIIAKRLKLTDKIILAKDLREVDYGVFSNVKKYLIKSLCPEYKNEIDYVFPGGESYLHLDQRVNKIMNNLEKKHDSKNILIVSHSGVLRSVYCKYLGHSYKESLDLKFSHDYVGKFSIKNSKSISYDVLNYLQ